MAAMRLVELIRRQPVRSFVVITGAIPVTIQGIEVFGVHNFTGPQEAWLTGAPLVIGALFGLRTVPNMVASKPNIEKVSPHAAYRLWESPDP
jgi:hypothetical protein